jgi:hypothetical protein
VWGWAGSVLEGSCGARVCRAAPGCVLITL